MTWVVGYNALFGHVYLVSDIQITVTHSDGTQSYHDCCRKIYTLGNFISGGFAGSVKLGFQAMESLRQMLSRIPPDTAWELDVIHQTWVVELIRFLYSMADERERNSGCEILLASAHPTRNRGDAGWAETSMVRYRSPDFEPEYVVNFDAISIGSGAEKYKRPLERLAKNFDLMQAVVGENGDMNYGNAIYHAVRNMVENDPIPGVSNYFHVLASSRGRNYGIGTNSRTFAADGTVTEHVTPPTVNSYAALEEHINARNTAGIVAIVG